MNASEKTKYKLANAIKQVMKKQPLDKITVSEIVAVCDVTRPTFYRHFQDKYDLVNWYFDQLATKSFRQMGISLSLREGLLKKFELMREEGIFFTSAFSSQAQNCLMEYDFHCIYHFYSDVIKKNGVENLTEEIDFLLKMYCNGSIFMTAEWAKNGMKLSPSQITDYLIEALPPKLYDLLKCL